MSGSSAGRWTTVLVIAGLACTSAQGNDTGGADTGRASATDGGASTPSQAPGDIARPDDGHAWVIFGADTVVAEMAVSADERAEGLMYREDLPDGTGMLFVFTDADIRSFWMSNTYLPLDIAYLDAAFTVVDIQQLEPLDTTSRASKAPAMYALEVRQGWFAERGIAVGARANIVFGVPGGP